MKIPLESERIEASAVGSISWLEGEKNWDGINGIFESPTKKPRQIWSR